MTDDLLYFPYINMPQSNWTAISILYWDSVGAIIPNLYKDHPNRLERNMRELVENELVRQVFPYEYVYQIPNFDQAFIELTEALDFDLKTRQRAFGQGITSLLHVQKFSDRLLNELVEKRLAQRVNWEWYMVEQYTARMFMTYLATVISKADGLTPATDSTRNMDMRLSTSRFPYYRLATRNQFINDLIPYPVIANPLELRHFKDRHGGQLKTFRNRLEQIIVEVTAIHEKEPRQRLYHLKLQEINQQREEIYARLVESRLGKITFGTVFGLIAAGIGLHAGDPLLGSFGFGNAVYSAFQGYNRRDILNNDFAYLALIDRKFVDNRYFNRRA